MGSMANKQVVVTGATRGLGRHIAERLASLGANVLLACRDHAAAEKVAERINADTGNDRATVMTVDTSDQSSIRGFARAYRARYGTLDVLVNNAGVLRWRRETSIDGIELTFATNVIGYWLTTVELVDALHGAAPSRVVNVASTYASEVTFDDLEFERRPYDGMAAYAQSKACNRMLTRAFARRLEPYSITVNSMAPGLMLGTDLYRELPPDARHGLEQLGGRSVPEGTETAVWLASDPGLDGVTGRFFEQCAEVPCQFRDDDAEERLWQRCHDLTHHPAPPV